jgi:hypothetical protein
MCPLAHVLPPPPSQLFHDKRPNRYAINASEWTVIGIRPTSLRLMGALSLTAAAVSGLELYLNV